MRFFCFRTLRDSYKRFFWEIIINVHVHIIYTTEGIEDIYAKATKIEDKQKINFKLGQSAFWGTKTTQIKRYTEEYWTRSIVNFKIICIAEH